MESNLIFFQQLVGAVKRLFIIYAKHKEFDKFRAKNVLLFNKHQKLYDNKFDWKRFAVSLFC